MSEPRPLKGKITQSYLTVFAVAVLFYVVSCAPGSLWQDSGMFQYRIWNNDIEGGLGLALAHPLYHLIGIAVKQLPFGEFGYRVNLMSAVFAAFTVANVFLLLRLWLGKNLPAVMGAITLAVSWTFWQHGVIAEVYSLYTAVFTAELVVLLQYFKDRKIRWLYLLGFLNGLSIANHMWGVIPLACYGILLLVLSAKKRIDLNNLLCFILFWVVGALPYEYLIVKELLRSGDFTATMGSVFFGAGWAGSVLNSSVTLRIVLENIAFIGYNFATLNLIFLFVGLFGLYRTAAAKGFSHIMLALLIMFFVFAFRYTVPDRYAFFLPFYCLVSCFMGVGIYQFLRRKRSEAAAVLVVALALLPVAAYGIVPKIAEGVGFNLGTGRTIPYRNEYVYFLRPWQGGNNGPELFARDALNSVEDDSVIIADGTTVYALWYLQAVKAVKRGVKIVSRHGNYHNPIEFPAKDNFESLLAERSVYVVSIVAGYCPAFILENYDFVQTGSLYRVVKKG